jgi:hypothetical protein
MMVDWQYWCLGPKCLTLSRIWPHGLNLGRQRWFCRQIFGPTHLQQPAAHPDSGPSLRLAHVAVLPSVLKLFYIKPFFLKKITQFIGKDSDICETKLISLDTHTPYKI